MAEIMIQDKKKRFKNKGICLSPLDLSVKRRFFYFFRFVSTVTRKKSSLLPKRDRRASSQAFPLR